MKRRRFIAGVLVLSMLLMGTGYAYWTDKLEIKTTAETGKLDVKFLDSNLYGYYADENGWSIVNGIGNDANLDGDELFNTKVLKNLFQYTTKSPEDVIEDENYGYTLADGTVALDKNSLGKLGEDYKIPNAYPADTSTSDGLVVTLDNLYPGYAQIFRADIANVGTLAAKLSQVKANLDTKANNDRTQKMLGVAIYAHREYSTKDPNPDIVDVYTSLSKNTKISEDDFFTVGGVKFLRLSALGKLNSSLSDDTIKSEHDLLYVKPDTNRMDVYFAIAMDPDANGKFTTGSVKNFNAANDGKDSDSQLQKSEVTVQFLWDQFNVGKDSKEGTDLGNEQKGNN
jgi:hypothetical protein